MLELEPVSSGEQTVVLERLVSGDPEGRAEFGGFYGRASNRLMPLLGPDRRVWLIKLDDVVAGFVDADNNAGRVELAYFVAASYRGQGVAARALTRLLTARTWPDATVYAATIAESNTASAAVVRVAGFREVGRTDDDESVWEYRRSSVELPGPQGLT